DHNDATLHAVNHRFSCFQCSLRPLYETAGATDLAASGGASDPLINSTKLTRDIVEKRHTHQKDEQRYADLLAEGLGPLGQRAAFQPLDGLKQDLPAVENRNGQHIQKSQRQ